MADTSTASTIYPAHSIWSLRRTEDDPLAFLQTLASRGGDIVPFQLGRHPAFLLNHPAAIEDVFVRYADRFVKGRGFDRARRLLGDGLLTANPTLHSERRRVAQAAFHRGRMPDYAPLIVGRAERLRDRWERLERGVTIDAGRDMREMTLAIAGDALFGADLESCAADVGRAVAEVIPSMDGLMSLVALPRRARSARRRLDAIIDDLVERRRRSGERREDLLSLLLDASDGSEAAAAQLRDDAVTFLLAGHDTLAHALTWTWMLLAEHPEAETRLGAELSAAFSNRLPRHEDLERLTFTRSVLAEALRLFPPAWVIVRRAIEPHECGGTLMPAGAIAVASPFVTHRDARFFPDPLAFRPERWLAEPAGRAAYFPFGAGSRSCIGESFAWLEGTLALATLARYWRLRRPFGAPILASPRITLRPKGVVLMTPEKLTA